MIQFLRNFFRQSGIWVASSFFVTKISAFLITLFMARMLTKEDFGWVMYGLNYLGFFLPFIGFGSSNGTLRYVAIEPNLEKKAQLNLYSFSYGLVFNFLLNIVMLVLAFILFGSNHQTLLIAIFSVRLLGVYLLEQAKSEIRANHDNEKFAKLEIYSSLLLLFSSVLLTYFLGVKGYIISLCLSPFLILFFHNFKFSLDRKFIENIQQKEFWKYCFSMAITNQLSELIFLLDIFFIGIFLGNTEVAQYRIYSVIPFNLFFISALFFQTSYPKLCEKHRDNSFQIEFLINFLKIVVPVVLLILAVAFYFDQEILKLFGGNYHQETIVFRILILASVSVILLRTPFGYLLASKGESRYNLIAAIISIIGLLVFIKPVISSNGLEGVAWLSLANLTFVGVFLMGSYFYLVQKK